MNDETGAINLGEIENWGNWHSQNNEAFLHQSCRTRAVNISQSQLVDIQSYEDEELALFILKASLQQSKPLFFFVLRHKLLNFVVHISCSFDVDPCNYICPLYINDLPLSQFTWIQFTFYDLTCFWKGMLLASEKHYYYFVRFKSYRRFNELSKSKLGQNKKEKEGDHILVSNNKISTIAQSEKASD